MKPVLKEEILLTNYEPLDSFAGSSIDFNVQLILLIGPQHELGEEIFNLTVRSFECYVEAFGEVYKWQKHELLLNEYDPDIIKLAVEKLLYNIDLPNWGDIVNKLRENLIWEYE